MGRSGGLVFPSLLRIFQFVVIHTIKGFGIVNKAEVDVFLEFSFFFYNPADVGSLISGSNWKLPQPVSDLSSQGGLCDLGRVIVLVVLVHSGSSTEASCSLVSSRAAFPWEQTSDLDCVLRTHLGRIFFFCRL